ncbi:anti-sigma factor [Flavobacterium pallidum]|uniref:Anti-sigma factor n=2 Tax=Flavobacterium pallidum TaxID=2172098 RepID=A0A2S1SJ66_9FLAO|nr:anti-sigma factor [Flavobacterium pallidum]
MEYDNKKGFHLSDFDTEEPPMGHHQRFMERLEGHQRNKKRFPYTTVLSIAASIVVLLGIWISFNPMPSDKPMAKLSAENRETQEYFTHVIHKELASLKAASSPETKPILDDAFRQLQELDNDYNKLMKELSEKGENKQIIHAMITNLQTRISFLERVETQIDRIKQFKSKSS